MSSLKLQTKIVQIMALLGGEWQTVIHETQDLASHPVLCCRAYIFSAIREAIGHVQALLSIHRTFSPLPHSVGNTELGVTLDIDRERLVKGLASGTI